MCQACYYNLHFIITLIKWFYKKKTLVVCPRWGRSRGLSIATPNRLFSAALCVAWKFHATFLWFLVVFSEFCFFLTTWPLDLLWPFFFNNFGFLILGLLEDLLWPFANFRTLWLSFSVLTVPSGPFQFSNVCFLT